MLNCVNALEQQLPETEQPGMGGEEKIQQDSCKNTTTRTVFFAF